MTSITRAIYDLSNEDEIERAIYRVTSAIANSVESIWTECEPDMSDEESYQFCQGARAAALRIANDLDIGLNEAVVNPDEAERARQL